MNARGWHLSRRTMLRGLGAAIALPMLEVMAPAATASTGSRRTRLAYVYFPNGVPDGAWDPAEVSETGELTALNAWMRPLEPFRKELLLFRNVWTPKGNGHVEGTATWLTDGSYDDERINAGGISADQLAAQSIGRDSLLPSLEMSRRGEGFFSRDLPRNALSWSSPTTPVAREVEPQIIFDRMFRAGQSLEDEQSVLDQVLEDARGLRRRVSIADQRKLDEYLQAVRSVEKRLEFAARQTQRGGGDAAVKRLLERPPAGIPGDDVQYMRLMFDMIVLAFWSEATRVCTFMLDHGQSNRYFDGVQGTWHALSHWRDSSGKTEDDDGKTSWTSVESKRDMYNTVVRWHHELLAYFLEQLRSIKEGDGTLLDSSMIVYGSEMADGHDHAPRNLPLLLAGRGGDTIKPGRLIDYKLDTSMSNLHLALLQRLAVKIDAFGDSREPMSELVG